MNQNPFQLYLAFPLFIQARISYAFKDPKIVGITKSIIYMRIVEGIILLPIFIVCFTFVALANKEFKGTV